MLYPTPSFDIAVCECRTKVNYQSTVTFNTFKALMKEESVD